MMAPHVVIRAEGVGKKYVIGHQAERERYTALRDVIGRTTRNFLRTTRDMLRGRPMVSGDNTEEFWALKDVSFEIKRSEVLGIIGRNGAGKSTLLKILSRITEPSEGRVQIRGRVASLLEVGTGFHPELTGRENIYLNAAILGMTRTEIRQKFDEIVSFAEIDSFLDTPVKRYSSGMYVRLAFSIAAHLDSEILIVDEVLAVGDTNFQNKCLGKMGEVSNQGRTVLVVSHDLARIATLCTRGILLDRGRIEKVGPIGSIIDAYLGQRVETKSTIDLAGRGDRSGIGTVQFQCLELLRSGLPCNTFGFGETLVQRVRVKVHKHVGPVVVESTIRTTDGISVHQLVSTDSLGNWNPEPGVYDLTLTIKEIGLYPGTYSIDLWAGDWISYRLDYMTSVLTFNVIQTPESGVSRPLDNALVFQPSVWKIEQMNAEVPVSTE